MNAAANDNASALPTISAVKLFALGRSGRRVDLKRGVSFGVELVWSTGMVTQLSPRFPAMFAAAQFGATVYRVGEREGAIA